MSSVMSIPCRKLKNLDLTNTRTVCSFERWRIGAVRFHAFARFKQSTFHLACWSGSLLQDQEHGDHCDWHLKWSRDGCRSCVVLVRVQHLNVVVTPQYTRAAKADRSTTTTVLHMRKPWQNIQQMTTVFGDFMCYLGGPRLSILLRTNWNAHLDERLFCR